MKIPLIFTVFGFISFIVFYSSCQDDFEKDVVQFGVKPKFKIEIHDAKHILKENSNLNKLITEFKNPSLQSKLFSSTYNFEIDEEYVQVIDYDDFKTFAFKIERTIPPNNLLENYIVKVVNGTIVGHFLIQYPFTINNSTGERTYMQNNVNFIELENPNWSQQARIFNCPPGSVPELISTETTYTNVSVNCTGGNHEFGNDKCQCGKTDFTCSPAYQYVEISTIFNWGCSGGSSGTGDPSSNTSSGGNTSTTTNDDSNLVTTPFEIIDEKKIEDECKRIKDFLNTNTAFRDSIIALAQTAATATSEKAVTLQTDGTITSHNGVDGKVVVPQSPTKSYSAIMHIHNGSNKYSIFSAGDLIWTGETSVLNKKIDSRQFISFLATGKGTFYAFTITNAKKFNDFYNYLMYKKTTITAEERMNHLNVAKSRQELWDKYYNDAPIKIKEDSPSTDKEIELQHFIDMLLEGDFGVSVFETNSSFSNFSPLQKNPINGATPKIIRKQCQN